MIPDPSKLRELRVESKTWNVENPQYVCCNSGTMPIPYMRVGRWATGNHETGEIQMFARNVQLPYPVEVTLWQPTIATFMNNDRGGRWVVSATPPVIPPHATDYSSTHDAQFIDCVDEGDYRDE